jgi:hypothetical protein
MSQSDFNIDNVSRSLFRAENNTALQALASLSSGATEPTTPYAYQLWADTSSGLLKLRNAANTDWIAKGLLSAVDWGYLASSGGTVSGDVILSGSSLIETEGASVTAASTTDIWATDGNTIHITGNTTITSFGTAPQAGAWMKLVFDGTPQLTQSADLNLNAGGSNIAIEAGDIAFVYADTATQMDVIVHRKSGLSVVGAQGFKLPDVDASVAANALTVTINPINLDFRSTTLTDGTPVNRSLLSPSSLVVPNTATLGTVNAISARLAILAIDNAGTIEPAIVNLAGGNNLDETNLISTTALSASSDSANVIYSTTARTNVAFRVVGFIDISEAAAGVWASNPTLVQPAGGQAIAALSSLGYGQTDQDLTGSRSVGTTYYNTTGKPIFVFINGTSIGAGATLFTFTANGVARANNTISAAGGGYSVSTYAIIYPGQSYVVGAVTNCTINKWIESR